MIRAVIVAAMLLLVARDAGAAAESKTDAIATPPVVTVQKTVAGTVYADPKGVTLYSFDRDKDSGKSACTDICAENWTPFAAAWIAKPVGDWSIVSRDDGTRQWAYKNRPLYVFAGDRKAGETNGDGADGAWHAVVETRKFMPAGVTIQRITYSNLGPALATTDGKTLYLLSQYRFNPLGTQRHDPQGVNPGPAGCVAKCVETWLPFRAEGDVAASGDWSIVARADGTRQWAYKGWPLYTYVNDSKPGEANAEAMTTIQNGVTGLMWEVATLP